MASVEQGPASNGLVERVKNILFTPQTEWDRIEAEPATVQSLYLGYACILAAIGPIASMISAQLFGWGGFFIRIHPPLMLSLAEAITRYVGNLAGVFVLALVIDGLAKTFGGTPNRIQAFKVAVYSSTAAWIAGVFALFPLAAALGIIGIYSLYLFYLGLPKLMKVPQERTVVYAVVTIVVACVIFAVVLAMSNAISHVPAF